MNLTTTSPRRGLRALAAAGIAACALVLAGAPAHAASHHVVIKQYMYMPMAMTIAQGDTVTWTNEDTVEHNVAVTSGPVSFTSPMLAHGKSWSHTFDTSGPYSYVCSVHPDMKATVTVTAATPTAPPTHAHAATPSAPASAGATAPTSVPKASRVVGAKAVGRAEAAEAAAAPAVSTAAPTAVSAPPSSATLQPLILVVGASVVAMVFCLLLMASRPVAVVEVEESPSEDLKPGRRRLEDS